MLKNFIENFLNYSLNCLNENIKVSNRPNNINMNPNLDINNTDTKLYNLVNIINSKPNGKFLIFSNYTFKKIINKLNENKEENQ